MLLKFCLTVWVLWNKYNMVDAVNNNSFASFVSGVSKSEPVETVPAQKHGSSSDTAARAIISAEAKMLNALEKYNSGQSGEAELMVANKTAQVEVEANAKVIETQNEIHDTLMEEL